MADTKILNLDEMLAAETKRVIIWRDQEHPVAGMTGYAYLNFLRARTNLDKAQKSGDEAAQFEQNLAIIGIVVPTLEAHRDELLKLNIQALTALVQFVIAEADVMTAPGQGEQAPGESTSPA